LISEVSKTSPEAPATRPASVAPARRPSSSSGGEDPDEKRQKFLERNRYVTPGRAIECMRLQCCGQGSLSSSHTLKYSSLCSKESFKKPLYYTVHSVDTLKVVVDTIFTQHEMRIFF